MVRKEAKSAGKKVEGPARHHSELLRPFAEANLVGIVIADASGRVLEANDYYLRTVGYTRDEFEQGKVDWRALTPPEWLPADEKAIEELRARGTSAPYEKEYVRRDGTRVSVFLSNAMLPGSEERIIAFVLDVTERKRAERALEETTATLQALIKSSPLAIIALDPEGLVTLWNPAAERMFGWSEREALGRFLPLVPEDRREEHAAMRQGVLGGEGFADVEVRRRRKDGSPIDISISTAPLRDAQGRSVGVMSVSADITERKKAEEKLRRSERNLAESERIGNTGSWDYDVATDTASWSENMFRIFDVDPAIPQELVFTHFVEDLVHPDDRANVLSVFRDALTGTRPYDLEYRIIKRNGEIRDIHAIAETVRDARGTAVRMIGKVEDVTEPQRARQALREREQHLSNIYDTVGDVLFHLAVEPGGQYRFVSINRAFSRVTGLKPEQVVGRAVSEVIPEPSLTVVLENYRRSIEEKRAVLWVETSDYPTGQLIGEVSVAPVFDDQGRCTHLVGSVHDVTERTRAEEALKASEERFRMITEQTLDLISITDADGVIVYASPASKALFQLTPEEMCGHRFIEFLAEPGIPEAMAAFRDAQAREERTKDLELTMKRKDGSTFVGELNGSIFRYGRQNGTLVVIRDITERKRAAAAIEASLREKDILLREIHHRVKNNMQVISSLLNLQAGHIADGEARRMLREGQLRIRSMALIHEKLYQARDLSRIEFASYIRSLAAYLFEFFKVDPGQVRLEIEVGDVRLDINSAVPCGLLISELISNALKHAFPKGRKGTVSIRLRREKDGSVKIKVADDGVGLPESMDFRRTESFGLQIVDLLIGQLEGTIELDRKKGTAFTVSFRDLEYKPRT